ncbi:Leucine-rich repeat [Trinorchestia longiramus]|nr:Leucine-rich repeat [Trinorchestia longiramus]
MPTSHVAPIMLHFTVPMFLRGSAGETEVVLDLSGRKLSKLEKAPSNRAFATALVLDDNCLQNLTNLDSYGELQRISLSNNKVVRMYWFARMYSLRILNLPGNNIVTVEGLKELQHLVHLNLAANSIKTMDGITHCQKLQHLNLSGNSISAISDLTSLRNLKELFLHRNRLLNLFKGNKYLPTSLVILTLSDNLLSDLNDLCHLSHLANLEQFTILNNPCLQPFQPTEDNGLPSGPPLAFDYRPYVINWCLNLKVLDGYKVTPMESLKGEWLYSQGRGRGFQLGEHGALVQYLSGVCLVGGGWGGAALPQHDHKLVKILQLAKQHQNDLRQKEGAPDLLPGNAGDEPHSLGAAGSPSCGRGQSVSQHSSPASQRRVPHTRPPPHNRRHTAPTRICPADRRGTARASYQQHQLKLQKQQQQQQQQQQQYHVELSSTLYGGGLKTPDTPCGGLMTQSMDPSMLLGPLGDGAMAQPSCGVSEASSVMTRSLGAEQLHEALNAGPASSSETKGYRLYDFNAKRVLLSRDVVFNESQFMSFEKEPSKEIECVPWSFLQEEKHEDSEGELELRRSTRNRAAPDRFGGWV